MPTLMPRRVDIALALGSLLFIASFVAFWSLLGWARAAQGRETRRLRIFFLRCLFALGAGLIPAIILPRIAGCPIPFGPFSQLSLPWAAGSAVVALAAFIIGLVLPKNEEARAFYPLQGGGPWSSLDWLLDIIGWTVYLGAYEYGLRGYLPGLLVLGGIGYVPAAALMIVIYAAGHIHKGAREAWVCLPFGALLHAVVALSGGILPGWALHVALGLGNDAALVRPPRKAKA